MGANEENMKTKLIAIVCAITLGWVSTTPAFASTRTDTVAVGADAVVGRPLCFAATILGSAVFLVSLPVAATSGSIHSSAEALVLKPARATFVRPLGDFSSPKDTSDEELYSGTTTSKKPLRAKAKG